MVHLYLHRILNYGILFEIEINTIEKCITVSIYEGYVFEACFASLSSTLFVIQENTKQPRLDNHDISLSFVRRYSDF